MISRRNPEPLRFLPDESRGLPPPKLTDPRLLYIGFLGYCSGLVDNVIRRRPVVSAEKKTYAEIFEKFHPVR
uniref:NADH:ubiquinone oxidoreductase subunit C2 n=1 Tax=Piliocolobus tephrosceles TaxID=591936 RepID=A0A8C9IIM0_9PRIM